MTQIALDMAVVREGLTKDCFQTPDYAVRAILPLLSKKWEMLDPCCGKGNIVRLLRSEGFYAYGFDAKGESEYTPFPREDFLSDLDLSSFDCIVTNPPYSCYGEFLAKCVALDKPFALLVPDSFADSLERFQTLQAGGVDIIYPPRRIAFETPTGRMGADSKPQMLTVWLTRGLDVERLQGASGRVKFLGSME